MRLIVHDLEVQPRALLYVLFWVTWPIISLSIAIHTSMYLLGDITRVEKLHVNLDPAEYGVFGVIRDPMSGMASFCMLLNLFVRIQQFRPVIMHSRSQISLFT